MRCIRWAGLVGGALGTLATMAAAQEAREIQDPRLGRVVLDKTGTRTRAGSVVWRDPQGVERLRGGYSAGRPHGLWLTHYPSGQIASETRYVNGALSGVSTTYYENGVVARRQSFHKGLPHGWRSIFDERGDLREEREYKKGRLKRFRSRRHKGDLFSWDGHRFFAFKPRKYCRFLGHQAVCRQPKHVFDTMSSIRGDAFAADVLDELEDLLDKAEGAGDLLFACGRSERYRKTDLLAGPAVREVGADKATVSMAELQAMTQACRPQPGGGSVGGPALSQGQSNAIAAFDRGVSSCSTRSTTGSVQSGAAADGLLGSGSSSAAGPNDPTAFPGMKKAGSADWFTEAVEKMGFGAPVPVDGGLASRSLSDPALVVFANVSNPEVVKFFWARGDQLSVLQTGGFESADVTLFLYDMATGKALTETWYFQSPNGGTYKVFRDYRNNTATYSTFDARGNLVDSETISLLDRPAPPIPEPPLPLPSDPADVPAPSDPTPAPSDCSNGGPGCPAPTSSLPPLPTPAPLDGGGGARMPNPEDRRTRCEKVAQAWSRFREDCDRSGWQTYTCQEFLRLLSGCVSTSEILPTPDGGTACESGGSGGDGRRAKCEQRRMFESVRRGAPAGLGRFVDAVSSCDAPIVNERLGLGNICVDPRAMCRPDEFFETERERPR